MHIGRGDTLKSTFIPPWPWIGSYDTPSYITHRPLPTRQISFKLENFLWTDRRTLRPVLLVDLTMKSISW